MQEPPNQRGKAARSNDKLVRVGTFMPVLEMCINTRKPKIVIEHGMGSVSTPYLHSIPSINEIISFENQEMWRICADCQQKRNRKPHSIMSYSNFKDDRSLNDCLLFVDGQGDERRAVLKDFSDRKIPLIVEHDVEWHSKERFNDDSEMLRSKGYSVFQYVGKNPETGLYCLDVACLKIDNNFIEIT